MREVGFTSNYQNVDDLDTCLGDCFLLYRTEKWMKYHPNLDGSERVFKSHKSEYPFSNDSVSFKIRGFEPSKFGHVLEYPRVNKFIHLMILSMLLSLRIPMTSHDVQWCPMVANLQTMLRVGFDQLIVPRECIREHLIEPVQRYVCS